MITDTLFNKNVAGYRYQLYGGYTYSLRDDGRFAGTATDRLESVILTGWYIRRDNGNDMYQTVGNEYIDLSEGWQADSLVYNITQSEAQRLVNTIINCNKQIIGNNILCARYASKLSTSERKQLYDLQKRLEERNNALVSNGVLSDVTTSYPQGYVYLQSYLDKFMASGGIGSVTVTIVVAAIVIASLSTAAYFAYKYYAQEAEQDVKYSKQLTSVLTSKLTDAEYQQLLEETKGIVTKAKIRTSLGNYGSMIGIALLAAGALLIYRRVKQ